MKEFIQQIVNEILAEETIAQNVVAIYPGRFQPMGYHHAKVYKWGQSKFGANNIYISTSTKVEKPKSPLSFSEKEMVIRKHGFKNIIQINTMYNGEEYFKRLTKFKSNETALVMLVGEKDGDRLNAKYFEKISQSDNLTNLKPYLHKDENGKEVKIIYWMSAPHISLKVSGFGEMSGTTIRSALGQASDNKESLFKDIMGFYDKKIYDTIVPKFEELYEGLFIPKSVIERWAKTKSKLKLNEISTSISPASAKMVDDGPNSYIPNNKVFMNVSLERAAKLGWEVVKQITSDEYDDYYEHPIYPQGPPNSVPDAENSNVSNEFEVDNAQQNWLDHMTRTMALVGWSVVKDKHTKDDIKTDAQIIKQLAEKYIYSKFSNIRLKEDLRKWFGKGKSGTTSGGGWDRYGSDGQKLGKCGDGDAGDAYAACLSKEKAAKLGPKRRKSFVRRKRAAQKKAGDSKKGGEQSKGQKPTLVKTKANENTVIKDFKVVCDRCNWKWDFSDGGSKPYLCHKCNYDNTSKYKKLNIEERLQLFLEKNIPNDPQKWSYAKTQAKNKFDVYPSAYANGWASKKYKELGGTWKKSTSENVDTLKNLSSSHFKVNIIDEGGVDGGEPETMFLPDGKKRRLNKGKPEDWLKQLGFTQIDFPTSDWIRGRLKKDRDPNLQTRKVSYRVDNIQPNTLKNNLKPVGVDKWINVEQKPKPKKNKIKLPESVITEISMGDLVKIDQYANKQLNPMNIVLTNKHFFDRLTDLRNDKPITSAELIGFFKRLSKNKKMFIKFLKHYDQLVAKDNRTNINIPFMIVANKLIAKTVIRKSDFKTLNPTFVFEDLFTTDNALKQYEKLLIGSIIEFMRGKYGISSKIIVKKKQSRDLFGDVVLNDNTLNKDKFYLHFNPNASYSFIIESIIHELIHVKQISKGELRPSKDYKELLWKGNPAISVSDYKKLQRKDYNKYKKLPWELEAYNGMKPLYKEFLKSKQFQSLKGKDENLDYIISNLTENLMMGYPDQKWIDNHKKELKRLRSKFNKEKGKDQYYEPVLGGGLTEDLIIEGGAAGHMMHLSDDLDLTFGELKQIVNDVLQGNIKTVTEKLDGQNLMVSWKGGKAIFARNKGHIKGFGIGAMDALGVKQMFSGRGDLEEAFYTAAFDLQNAISKLSQKQRDKIFGEGSKWMNFEVMYPATTNVIPYNHTFLVFHGSVEYDESGNPIGGKGEDANILAGMIKQVNANLQSKYEIRGPVKLTITPAKDFSQSQSKYLSQINKLQSEFKLKDSDKVGMYHYKYWEIFIDKKSPTKLDDVTKNGLVLRWAYDDKSFRLDKNTLPDVNTLEWAKGVDKGNLVKLRGENMNKFDVIFLQLGAEVLKNMSGFLAANPDEAVQSLRKEIESAIPKLMASNDPKMIELVTRHVQRLEKMGGLGMLVPTEGIVFNHNGKIYKMTGIFASANQILGAFRYGI